MHGMKSERVATLFLRLFFISTIFVVYACARHQIVLEKGVEKKGVYHVVEKHQTLYRICKTYHVDMKQVASLNGIADPHRIQQGQRIFIPGAKKVLKVEVYIDDVVLESGERGKIVYKKMDFLWPVRGPCVNLFDEAENKRHQGVDISSPLGTPIKASNPGVVIYSGNTIRGYGNLVILRHSEELVTLYAHNQMNLVTEGTWVEKGQIIGEVGQTGNASGPHLHFEVRKNNKAVDPMLFLE